MTPEPLLESVLEQCQVDGMAVALVDGKLVITGQQAALDEWLPVLRGLKSEGPRLSQSERRARDSLSRHRRR